MNKSLLIIGGAIAGLLVLGGGAVLGADLWLDGKVETELTTQLTQKTGVKANVGQADVQLLRKKVTIDEIQLPNLEGFPSANIITIKQIELTDVGFQKQPFQVATAVVDGVQIYVDGSLDNLSDPSLANEMPKLNLLQFIEQLDRQSQSSTSSAVLVSNNVQASSGKSFTVDQLTLRNIDIKINLQVPWQEAAIAHELKVPEIVLNDVDNLNIGDKIAESLGVSLSAELQAFVTQEILPNALQYMQKSIPKGVDPSKINVPKDANVPKNIQLP